MIYIFTRSYIIVNLWYQNLKLDKTYLPKGYLIFVISGMVSLHQVHFQNAQLYSTRLVLWKLRRLKVEKWGLIFHIIIAFVFWYDTCHHNTDLRAGQGQKISFSRSFLCHFHFLVSFKWFVTFSYCTNRADLQNIKLHYICDPTSPNKCFFTQFQLF